MPLPQVATFIVQKILLDDLGLGYICATGERFYAVNNVLNNMITMLEKNRSGRLLKQVVRCFSRLAENAKARSALAQSLPAQLRDSTFAAEISKDTSMRDWIAQLKAV